MVLTASNVSVAVLLWACLQTSFTALAQNDIATTRRELQSITDSSGEVLGFPIKAGAVDTSIAIGFKISTAAPVNTGISIKMAEGFELADNCKGVFNSGNKDKIIFPNLQTCTSSDNSTLATFTVTGAGPASSSSKVYFVPLRVKAPMLPGSASKPFLVTYGAATLNVPAGAVQAVRGGMAPSHHGGDKVWAVIRPANMTVNATVLLEFVFQLSTEFKNKDSSLVVQLKDFKFNSTNCGDKAMNTTVGACGHGHHLVKGKSLRRLADLDEEWACQVSGTAIKFTKRKDTKYTAVRVQFNAVPQSNYTKGSYQATIYSCKNKSCPTNALHADYLQNNDIVDFGYTKADVAINAAWRHPWAMSVALLLAGVATWSLGCE
eukprot:Filipodium_phascolosomae@DN5969_c0_g1_i1.p1